MHNRSIDSIAEVSRHRSLNDPLTSSIRLLNALAIKLKAARIRAGALSLSSPELKIHLDSNEGAPEPIDVEQKAMLETNSLVEEFMLLANISVARKIQEAYPQTAVLRSVLLARQWRCRLTTASSDVTTRRHLPTLKLCGTSCRNVGASISTCRPPRHSLTRSMHAL